MSLRVALQMDPIAALNPRSDTTLALGRAAQKRGHTLFTYTPDTLSWNAGHITAHGHTLTLGETPESPYQLGPSQHLELAGMDIILLRQDPPFDMAYITSTHLLEQLPKRVKVFNHPGHVRNHPEKIMPLEFARFMPETLISAVHEDIEAFRAKHEDIVIKPLYGHGGRSVLRIKAGDGNLSALIEMHQSHSREPLMCQRFLPEVKDGDRRIILIDGEVMAVMGRIPAEGEIRANLRVGGSAQKASLTPRQKEICDTLGPILKEKELLLVGLDVIGDYLTEINLTSPTGIVQLDSLYGLDLGAHFWEAAERIYSKP